MTNEEKAREIGQTILIEDGIWHYASAEIAAITMAEWKDQQYAEIIDKWRKEAEVNHDAKMAYEQGKHDAMTYFREYLVKKRQKIASILEDITEEDARYFALHQRYVYLGIIINELFKVE